MVASVVRECLPTESHLERIPVYASGVQEYVHAAFRCACISVSDLREYVQAGVVAYARVRRLCASMCTYRPITNAQVHLVAILVCGMPLQMHRCVANA